ncbi:Alpha-ketoglutarate-dependent dioxygenase alkB [Smittium culicis]|uniref:Alpha-ketoglutarate-dependent dioxygenase alkB n=1 Tax=Smittium culicis TaxID=133412 RepID=A0A1R1XIU0_9FUNG|nr:Alpha-ketoglutarate-dependent dioxygenase alkB [Smittium culicis]OMJ17269.1 Alpha-ketoglutarate-dependent dioxygenase alkB [Smittium culicis]
MDEATVLPHVKSTTLSKRQQKIALKQRQAAKENNTNFRAAERNFKAKFVEPNMENVVDFSALHNNTASTNSRIRRVLLPENLFDLDSSFFKLPDNVSKLPETYKDKQLAYTLTDHPVIPNPFTATAQKHLVKNTLCDWARKPNKNSLDPFYRMSESKSLFEHHIEDVMNSNNPNHAPFVFKTLFEKPSEAQNLKTIDENESIKNVAVIKKECGNLFEKNEDQGYKPIVTEPKNEFYRQDHTATELLESIRWTTIGNQYNWSTKSYDTDIQAPISEELSHLMSIIVRSISGAKIAGSLTDDFSESHIVNSYDYNKYKVEAGVINYYGLNSTLLAHVDKSENNMEAPLISISLGCSCIYLVGGDTKQDTLTPILLRSGDIIASCGASRTSYHGVPRIFENSCPSFLTAHSSDSDTLIDPANSTHNLDKVTDGHLNQNLTGKLWAPYAEYISTHRINFNARQCNN